ncbi:MAG: hypothetical protein ACLGJC_29185 [Alphaproteobacteria bacterium]
MSIRKATVVALVSTMLFGTAAVLAAPQQDAAIASFASQLSEAKQALRDISSPSVGRSERIVASVNLQFAEYLFNQGRLVEAQQYLRFARGKLGLFDRSGGRAAPAPLDMQAFTPDFYNPLR